MDNPEIVIKVLNTQTPANYNPGNSELSLQDKIEAHQMINLMTITTKFILLAYSALLIFTMVIILFQGFRFRGFELDSGLLQWLGLATIGEIGGLISLVYWFFFKKGQK